jgi:hypothetical protein
MSDKIFGDLEIFGVVTVGSRTDGVSGAYTLPFKKGDNGTILGIAPAPSSTGLSGTMPQWLSPTSAPFNLVTASTLNTLVNSTSAATLCAANTFTLDHISDITVGISGQNGIQVASLGHNQFIISLYTPLSASLSVSPNTLEIGQSITACALNWSYNKSVVSQSLDNGIGSLPILQRAYNFTTVTPITTNRSFTVTGNDGTQNANSTATIGFYKRRFWGTIPAVSGGLPSNAQILAASSELSSGRGKSITFDCSTPSGGNFFWYCFPTSYGLSSVTVNNLSFTDWYSPSTPGVGSVSPATITVTNAYGHAETYYIYRVFNVQFGSSIPVVFG